MQRRAAEGGHASWSAFGLLFGALALTTLLITNGIRAERARRAAVDAAMRDYAAFASWELARSIRDNILADLFVAFAPAAPKMHPPEDGHSLTADGLRDAVLPQGRICNCLEGVSAFVRYDVQSDYFEISAARGESANQFVWVHDSLRSLAASSRADSVPALRRVPSPSGQPARPAVVGRYVTQGVLVAGTDAAPSLVGFILLRHAKGDAAQVYGFVVPAADFTRHVVDRVLAAERLLPDVVTGPVPTDSIVRVSVTTSDGRPLVRASAPSGDAYAHTDVLGREFGGLRLTAAINADAAHNVAPQPTSSTLPLPVLISLTAAIAVLLGAAALQLRRQQNFIQMRSDFIASVSHELRTPLSQIRLLAELLRIRKSMTEERRMRSLEIIDQEARRLTYLVENILTFASARRLVSSSTTLVPTHLRGEIQHAVEAFQPLAESQGTHIIVRGDADPLVALDAAALRQIVINLLDNALRYGRRGQTVIVELACDGDDVELSVDDEGPGVPDAERERIWEPYYRMSGHRDGVQPGHGLGLAVVAELVNRLHGRVRVDTGSRGGAKFSVAFAAVHPSQDAQFPSHIAT
jgi:signal transduction histidine kinase